MVINKIRHFSYVQRPWIFSLLWMACWYLCTFAIDLFICLPYLCKYQSISLSTYISVIWAATILSNQWLIFAFSLMHFRLTEVLSIFLKYVNILLCDWLLWLFQLQIIYSHLYIYYESHCKMLGLTLSWSLFKFSYSYTISNTKATAGKVFQYSWFV